MRVELSDEELAYVTHVVGKAPAHAAIGVPLHEKLHELVMSNSRVLFKYHSLDKYFAENK